MGGRQQHNIVWPRGVSQRDFKYEQRIQVAFSFQGVECRELLPPQKITQTSVNLAAGKRAQIQRRIADKAFNYVLPRQPEGCAVRTEQLRVGGLALYKSAVAEERETLRLALPLVEALRSELGEKIDMTVYAQILAGGPLFENSELQKLFGFESTTATPQPPPEGVNDEPR